jgi:hypothetical protein
VGEKKWGDLCDDFVRGPFGGSLRNPIFKEEGYVVYEQKLRHTTILINKIFY